VAKKRPTDRKLAADERVPIPAHLRPRPALHYELEHRVLWVLRSLTPGLNYLTKRYSRRWLRADSIAGVAVAAYLIPQVMAYSAIVNVPRLPRIGGPPFRTRPGGEPVGGACRDRRLSRARQLAHPVLRTRVHDRPDDRRGDCPAGRAEP
jgi:hypothetical protein